MRPMRWPTMVGSLLCLIGCLGDPVGPGGVLVVRRLSPVDSILVGAPGRPLPVPITFQAVDGDARPVPAATVAGPGEAAAGMASFWPTFNRVESTPGLALAMALQETPNFLPMVENVSWLTTTYSRVAAGAADSTGGGSSGRFWGVGLVAGGALVCVKSGGSRFVACGALVG